MAVQTATPVRTPAWTIAAAAAAQVLLLAALTATTGLHLPGWLAGIAFAAVGWAALSTALRRFDKPFLGPADHVTLARSVLVGCVTALVADAGHPAAVPVLSSFAAVALALDAVDGRVARRTRTASALGARFDMEVDAFLILVLSAYVATSLGAWVLLIGALRYVFVAAGRALSWLQAPLPTSMVRKTIAAAQGIALAVAASGVLPHRAAIVLIGLALAALCWSFGHDIVWLRRHRPTETVAVQWFRTPRRAVSAVVTTLAGLLVLFAMVAPERLSNLTPAAFVRIPVEGLIAVALVLVLPRRARTITAGVLGALLGLVTIVKLLDMGFTDELDRPFDLIFDWSFLGPAVDFLATSSGKAVAIAAVIGAILLVLALVALLTLSAVRLSRVATEHRTASTRTIAVLGVIWTVCGVTGVQVVTDQPVAATSAAALVYDNVRQVSADLRDRAPFLQSVGVDAFGQTPANQLLTGLRGKDVLLTFVESYGRVAVEDPQLAPGVDKVLDAGTDRLRKAGFQARTAYLTSSTFGGGSWLAHSTLQSGLWVNNQQRYTDLLGTDRLTLASAFKKAGWRTVSDIPSNTRDWPDGQFYGYDQLYDSRNVGYKGPSFSYATMPDQYTMSAFQRLEMDRPGRGPVMGEIDLVSSHNPWAPLPYMIDWNAVGDGSVFGPMPAQGQSKDEVWSDPTKVRAAYGQSIQYSLDTLISYIEKYGDDNLVMVFLGDHQPGPAVSGEGASRDVPITIVAHDPAVLDRIAGWNWQPGLRPAPTSPVWPMNTFRDRFLTAFGPHAAPMPLASVHH